MAEFRKHYKRAETNGCRYVSFTGNPWKMEEAENTMADVFEMIDIAFAEQTVAARNSKLSAATGISTKNVQTMIIWCYVLQRRNSVGKTIDAAEFASVMFKLYQLEIAVIKRLQSVINENTDLYSSLGLLKKTDTGNPSDVL